MSEFVAPPTSVAVAFHSGYGHTAVLAEAVRRGAVDVGADATLVPVNTITDEQWQQLDDADAIVFGSPTYMGSASAAFHSFAEATSRRFAEGRWADKLAAGFTNSASKAGDKSSTLAFFATFAAQHRMLWVSLGLAPGWNSTTASENDLNRLGFWGGAGAQTPLDGGVDTVHTADVTTAEHLGARVARQAALVAAGRRAVSVTA
ncbi:flavodoxin family protein [Streptomyces scopuliridis]|uniref:flavodoxin family protein n=1 Tax=Streptomyces scopuliridis TaxID=452529 RepID=UPI0036AFF134